MPREILASWPETPDLLDMLASVAVSAERAMPVKVESEAAQFVTSGGRARIPSIRTIPAELLLEIFKFIPTDYFLVYLSLYSTLARH